MNCELFQRVLPQIIEAGGNAEQEAHLLSCQACGELVRDLKYIAEQARLLLPMHDPNPRVWNNIQDSLAREGLIREGRTSHPGHTTTTPSKKKSWTPLGLGLALLSVLILTVLLIQYRPSAPVSPETTAPAAGASEGAALNGEDQVLVHQVSERSPEVSGAYENGLKEANNYIADATRAVNTNPRDPGAQEQLKRAYGQKATLYNMATARALE